jgi:hypothetical protein
VGGVIIDTQGLAGSPFQFLLLTRGVLQIIVHQVELNRQIQELWETAADMLSFLQEAKPVIEPPLLPTVSDMMMQVHACAVFIKTYGEKGFISM